MITRHLIFELTLPGHGDITFRIRAHELTSSVDVMQNAVQYEGGWLYGQKMLSHNGAHSKDFGTPDYGHETTIWGDASVNLSHFAVVTPCGDMQVETPDEPEVSGNPQDDDEDADIPLSEELIPAAEITVQEFIEQIAQEASLSSRDILDHEIEQLRGVARLAIASHVESAWENK